MSNAPSPSLPENYERLPEPVQLRLQTMAESALAVSNRLNERLSLEFRARASRTLTAIARGRIRRQQAILALWAIADQLGAAASELAACKRGCAHCCHIPVSLSRREAELIGRRIGRPPLKVTLKPVFEYKEYGYHNPCPFLADGQCSIYENRPFGCRAHFNLDVDALLCELIPDEVVPVPYLDVTTLQQAYVMANTEGLADIREFFGRGEAQKMARSLPSPLSQT